MQTFFFLRVLMIEDFPAFGYPMTMTRQHMHDVCKEKVQTHIRLTNFCGASGGRRTVGVIELNFLCRNCS